MNNVALKIDRIEMFQLRMPLVSDFETSFGSIATRDCILLCASAGDLVGFGECVADRDPGYSSETSDTAWLILQDFIIPEVLGKVIEEPGDIQKISGNVRGHRMAKAGLEMAVWDLMGKYSARSLRQMLGGERSRVPVGVSVGLQKSPEALVQAVSAYLEDGYQRVKIKIKPGRDVGDTGAVRQAYPALQLQVDANSAYNVQTAENLLPLDEFNLLLIEQPLAEDDLWDHRWLQERIRTPICLDESILSARHARQALQMKAARIINIKTGRVGGLSEAVAIHNLCWEAGVPVWCGGMLETGVGRAANLALASLPGFILPGDISATDRYYTQDITQERFQLNDDSTITVPDKPGLGIDIDWEAVSHFLLRQADFQPS